MARTKDEILNALLAVKDADPILSTILTSASKSAFYYALFDLFAEFTGDFELTFDDFVEQMDALLESKQVMTDAWWQQNSLDFQLGDTLVIFDNGNLGYAVIDEDLQIIERAAILTTSQGNVTLKVAKVESGVPVPLDSSELSAFDSYINDTAPSGIVVTIVSTEGDEIEIALGVEIDSQIIDVNDGTLLEDGTTKPVEDAVFEYFATFQVQGTGFGGTFYANNLMATILAATGVVNATFSILNKKGSNEPGFTDVLTLPGKKFGTFSGYVKLATGWDLSANITYSANG